MKTATLLPLALCSTVAWAFTPSSPTRQRIGRASKSTSFTGSNLGPAEAWSAYNGALEANPLIVKSVTAGIILGAADLAGQTLEDFQKKQEGDAQEALEEFGIDWLRSARFAIFGLVLQAPWNHFYYLALDGQIPPTTEPFTTTNGIKVLIDQFVQAPIFTVLIFVFLGTLEGKTPSAIKNQLNNDYKDTILANWKLWLPATVINIGFVPPLFRVLYLNGVFFFWSIYLSLKLNKKDEA
ncbi:predicted protein [Phaeodactylum tricornutum CCAP 1055/1]|uniref:Uncharacterized protein n=2 Tax=Phaeodactylum tricornutum TaxID=2850 RepID=B7FRB9_PHATC|nr:predicted protein [Phaeodactylum tricornutum CCAP 1055/1]EEC50981.1 predicted protein [Phaeodactylum tricornutum CCAP 1055/1]|eukprot:XP_002176518.1 predicted protein [Phaeodactylum tricornutum CCAP 1055/1]